MRSLHKSNRLVQFIIRLYLSYTLTISLINQLWWWIVSSVNVCNMLCHVVLLIESFVTYITFAWFIFDMKSCNMSPQNILSIVAFVTNVTFKWFLFLMSWFKMYLQVTFLGAAVVTNVTFERFLFLMNRHNIPV